MSPQFFSSKNMCPGREVLFPASLRVLPGVSRLDSLYSDFRSNFEVGVSAEWTSEEKKAGGEEGQSVGNELLEPGVRAQSSGSCCELDCESPSAASTDLLSSDCLLRLRFRDLLEPGVCGWLAAGEGCGCAWCEVSDGRLECELPRWLAFDPRLRTGILFGLLSDSGLPLGLLLFSSLVLGFLSSCAPDGRPGFDDPRHFPCGACAGDSDSNGFTPSEYWRRSSGETWWLGPEKLRGLDNAPVVRLGAAGTWSGDSNGFTPMEYLFVWAGEAW